MSVIGLSPSDILNSVAAVSQGLNALRERDGSKERFQQMSKNIRLRIESLEALDEYALSFGAGAFQDAARYAVQEVLDQELKAKGELDKYNSKLGQQASVRPERGVSAKLKWAFGGAQDQTERNARSVPAIDATILRSILLCAETSRQRDDDHLASLETAEANIGSMFGTHAGDTTKRIIDMENTICARVDESTAHIQQHTEQCANNTTTIFASAESRNRAQWNQVKADVLSEVESIKSSFASFVIRVFDELRKEFSSQGAQARTLEQNVERISNSGNFSLDINSQLHDVKQDIRDLHRSLLRDNTFQYVGHSVPLSIDNAQEEVVPLSPRNRQQRRFLPDIRKDVIKGGVLTISCVLYSHPFVKKAARALTVRMSCDPILALLIVCAGYFFARHLSNISISPLTGSQHTRRSSEPLETWPQIHFKKMRFRVYSPIGDCFIFNILHVAMSEISFTHRDLSSRYKQLMLNRDLEDIITFSMIGVQNQEIVCDVLAHELKSAPRVSIHGFCRCCHSSLHLDVDAQVVVNVFRTILGCSKSIPRKTWWPELPVLPRKPIMMRIRYFDASENLPKEQ